MKFRLFNYIVRHIDWSRHTFGPQGKVDRIPGVIDHLRKEIEEVAAKPDDLEEWCDVIILAIDGAWRSGHSPYEICKALEAKQAKNKERTWPNWRTVPVGKAIEHNREGDV